MAGLISTGIAGFLSSAKFTGKQILNKAGKLVPEIVAFFASGFDGHGWKIWEYIPGKWILEIDALRVRGTMTVFELLISKIRAIIGAQAITQGCGRIKDAKLSDDQLEYLITLEDKDMSLMEHDFIRCQKFGGTPKLYHVEITSVVDGVIHVSTEEFDYEHDEDGMLIVHNAPAAGDDIVQFGNSSTDEKYAGRHSAIYMHADESGQPAIDVLDKIYSKDWSECLTVRMGGDIPNGGGKRGFYCVNGMIKCEDTTGHTTYCLYPDGTAELGDGSALFKPDKSGHIAGGAISWEWSEAKNEHVCTMRDVVLTWDNLSDEAKDNLKTVVYELIPSTEIITMSKNGQFYPARVQCQVKKMVGSASSFMTAEEITADGLEYGWVRDDSGFIQITPEDSVAPHNDCFPIVFHLKQGDAYICSKSIVTVREGQDGNDGADGVDGDDGLSVDYRGELPNPPTNPVKNWCYRNTGDGRVYIYTGTDWKLMVADGNDGADGATGQNGLSVFVTYHDDESEPAVPTGNGTTGGWHTDATSVVVWMSQKVSESSDAGTWGNPIRIKGLPGEDANLLPWIKEWSGYATELGEEYIVTPKMFSGTKSADGKLTGIAQGKECITIDGVTHTGIFALVDNERVFELDPIKRKYTFKGNVEASSGHIGGFKVESYGLSNDGESGSYIYIETNDDWGRRLAVLGNRIPSTAGFDTASMFTASGQSANIAIIANASGCKIPHNVFGGNDNIVIEANGGVDWKMEKDDHWSMPGVLACVEYTATRDSFAGRARWGNGCHIGQAERDGVGRYIIPHNIGHSDYFITITPYMPTTEGNYWISIANVLEKGDKHIKIQFKNDGGNDTSPQRFEVIFYGRQSINA